MKILGRLLSFVLVYVLGMVFFSATASAYIDPSAMTYIVQLVVGIVIAGGAAFAFYFRKIKRKFKKKDTQLEDYDNQEPVDFSDDDEFDIKHMDEKLK